MALVSEQSITDSNVNYLQILNTYIVDL